MRNKKFGICIDLIDCCVLRFTAWSFLEENNTSAFLGVYRDAYVRQFATKVNSCVYNASLQYFVTLLWNVTG